MENILKWVKGHKKLTVLLIVAVIFTPIIVIHILFKIKTDCDFIIAEWKAGEILGYFGDVISFVGTIVLGYVAICQTEKANTISEKLMEIDLVKMKPCFDFINSQKYFMSLVYNGSEIEKKYERDEAMFLDILITANPRTGMSTIIGYIVFDVINSGHSDIRFIFVNNINFYLITSDKRNKNEKIAMLIGNSNIKVGETKKMLVKVRREFVDEEDAKDTWYKDNVEKIMPHLEMDLHIVTTDGIDYYENVVCGSNWDSEMKSQKNCIERELVVLEINVSTKSEFKPTINI